MSLVAMAAWRYETGNRIFVVRSRDGRIEKNKAWFIRTVDPDGNVFVCPNVYTSEEEAAEVAAMLEPKPPSDIEEWRYINNENRAPSPSYIN